jgi:hypothetical protein
MRDTSVERTKMIGYIVVRLAHQCNQLTAARASRLPLHAKTPPSMALVKFRFAWLMLVCVAAASLLIGTTAAGMKLLDRGRCMYAFPIVFSHTYESLET